MSQRFREDFADLFTFPAIAITTNGYVKRNRRAVMGRGVALQAVRKWPNIDLVIGQAIQAGGNIPHYVGRHGETEIFTFPVKHHWSQKADPQLIESSARRMVQLVDSVSAVDEVAIPRPGCGNGGLEWERVREILVPILDERFVIVDYR